MEDEMEHTGYTPGPWEIDFTGQYYKNCIRHNGLIVCQMPPRPKRDADAALIADAPRLAEENERLRELLKWAQARLFVHEGNSDIYEAIEVEIDHAEGRE